MYTVKSTYLAGEGIAERQDNLTLTQAIEQAKIMKANAIDMGFVVEGDIRRDRRYVCTDANNKSFRIWIELSSIDIQPWDGFSCQSVEVLLDISNQMLIKEATAHYNTWEVGGKMGYRRNMKVHRLGKYALIEIVSEYEFHEWRTRRYFYTNHPGEFHDDDEGGLSWYEFAQ